MTAFTTKHWLLCAFAALAWLLLGGKVASGQTATPGADNRVLSGFLTCSAGPAGQRECPFGLHYVTLTKGRTYSIQLASSDFHTALILEDRHGNLLARDGDDYDDLYGSIVFRPPVTGEYRLIARAALPNEGFYTISVRELPVVMNVAAALTPSDPADSDVEKTYDVVLTAGRRYVIDLESAEFASFVKLLNSAGAIIAFNDDCDGHGNARVIFAAERTGTYRLVASSFAPGAAGAFTLTVCED